ncbi:aspartic peptidase domain-containing protein [Gorgonomyces haynaldii]|nr:aspartic peptidase domain-containing protein [Gorgonomyces haynaldii]
MIVNIPTSLVGSLTSSKISVNTGVQAAAEVNFVFRGNVGVGTPPQQVNVVFDTGSTLSWAAVKNCAGCLTNGIDVSKSSTFKVLGDKGTIRYIDNTQISGTLVQDTLSMGQIRAQNQPFLAATQAVNKKSREMGVIGLGINLEDEKDTFFKTLVQQKQVAPVFSYFLDSTEKQGAFTFGGIDTNRYAGNLLWIPLQGVGDEENIQPNHWRVRMDAVTVNGKSILMTVNSAIFDSGTSLALFPEQMARQINQASGLTQQANGQWAIQCNQKIPAQLPPISLSFKTGTITLAPSDYLFFRGNLCVSAIQSFGSVSNELDAIMIGNALLRSLYTVHDLDSLKIGIAFCNRDPNAKPNYVEQTARNPPVGTATNIPLRLQFGAGSNETMPDRPLLASGAFNLKPLLWMLALLL